MAAGALPAPTTPDSSTAMNPLLSLPATPGRRSLPTAAPRIASAAASHPDDGDTPAPRKPTLTAQVRAVRAPDVARQALSELKLLGQELAVLPEQLEVNGLAPSHQRSFIEASRAYLNLAGQAWESIAEERLEQSGADSDHRQRAITVARRVSQLQQECQKASGNPVFRLPRKIPRHWHQRAHLITSGVQAWQERLSATPNPLVMGRALFGLRGAVGLASASGLALTLLTLLTNAMLFLLAALGIGAALAQAAYMSLMPPTAKPPYIPPLTLAGLDPGSAIRLLSTRGLSFLSPVTVLIAAAIAWPLVFFFARKPLGLLLGAAVYAPTRTTRNTIRPASAAVAGALRAWWLFISILGLVAIIVALVLSGIFLNEQGLTQPDTLGSWLGLGGTLLGNGSFLAAAAGVAALLLLAAPVLLITLARAVVELGGGPGWAPSARRYALAPALATLAPVIVALLVAIWFAATNSGWQNTTFFSLSLGSFSIAATLRGLALLLGILLPYLLLIELPYRIGIRRWRRAWLRDLTDRRADVESHVRRLSAADPDSGAQDTSDENLRAMQYDMVLLQFYQSKTHDIQRTPRGPYSPRRTVVALILVVALALLLDQGLPLLAQALATTR
jgi:hypothetical protein